MSTDMTLKPIPVVHCILLEMGRTDSERTMKLVFEKSAYYDFRAKY